MSRKPRVFCESGIYHVILRGNNKQNLFVDDCDRKFFLEKLEKYSKELEISVHAYCLMNNHVHILIGNAGKNMCKLVQKIACSYVYYFNRKHDRSGHLFQGRYKSEPILDDEQFKTVYRYILQNSEKAGIGKTEKFKWNSFWALNAKRGESFINSEFVLELFRSAKTLMEFVLQKENKKCMEYENKFVLSDDRAVILIKRLFGISSPYQLERLSVTEQLCKCRIMKQRGLSMSQIARVTGISRSLIRKS